MSNTITVIVSKARAILDGDLPSYRVYGDRLVDETFTDMDAAKSLADSKLGKGLSVILRPNYNETDENGKRYFREWRSFDGEALREVRWGI